MSRGYLKLLVKYAAEDRLTRLTQPVQPKKPFAPNAPKGAEPVRTGGLSGQYFKSDKSFYKAVDPSKSASAHAVEPHATAALAKLGNRVPQVEVEQHGDTQFLKSPLIGEHKELRIGPTVEQHDSHDTPDLHRLALSNWLIHAGDRHGGNYVLPQGQTTPVPIDYGKSFHPDTAHGDRNVGYSSDEYLQNHIQDTTPIHPETLQSVAELAPGIEEHVRGGTAGLSPQKQQEALNLYNEKLELLRNLSQSPNATFGQLPQYFGLRKQS